jgi:hypothetical protein
MVVKEVQLVENLQFMSTGQRFPLSQVVPQGIITEAVPVGPVVATVVVVDGQMMITITYVAVLVVLIQQDTGMAERVVHFIVVHTPDTQDHLVW